MRTVQSWKSTARSIHLSGRPTAYTSVFMSESKIKSYAVSCLHGCDIEDESVQQVPSKRSTERKGHAERSSLRQQRRLKRNKCPSGDTRFRTWTFCRHPSTSGAMRSPETGFWHPDSATKVQHFEHLSGRCGKEAGQNEAHCERPSFLFRNLATN